MTLPPVIDCHAHVGWHALEEDGFGLDQILARCERHGVAGVVYSLFFEEWELELPLSKIEAAAARREVAVGVSFGMAPPLAAVAPSVLAERLKRAAELACALAAAGRIVAIGEAGLDYYWPPVEYLEAQGVTSQGAVARELQARRAELLAAAPVRDCLFTQAEVFRAAIRMAVENDLPLVIHGREAYADIFEILAESELDPRRVMLHCFGGTADEALVGARRGYRISIPSSVGYRPDFAEVARAVDLADIVIETDSPYHSPFVGFWKSAGADAEALAPPAELGKVARQEWTARRRAELYLEAIEARFPELSFPRRDADGVRDVPAAERLVKASKRRKNEPSFVRCAAEGIAAQKGLPLAEVCDSTTANARGLFARLAAR